MTLFVREWGGTITRKDKTTIIRLQIGIQPRELENRVLSKQSKTPTTFQNKVSKDGFYFIKVIVE